MDKRQAAEQTNSTVALLSSRLERVIAEWESAIGWGVPPSGTGASALPGDPAVALARLEQELETLERERSEARAQIDEQSRLADKYEQRAMTAINDGRDDLARNELLACNEHRTAAEALTTEETVMTELADMYRRAIAAIRAAKAERLRG